MAYDFTPLIKFVETVFQRFRSEHPKSGKPYTYPEARMLIFLMTMFLKRIFTFKGMARYARVRSAGPPGLAQIEKDRKEVTPIIPLFQSHA